ncbi:MAG: hypothetical protein HWN68_04010 [Desulfobacterales bacterium]|nr:hypothetical protein [Desulfobacterales bacterium]
MIYFLSCSLDDYVDMRKGRGPIGLSDIIGRAAEKLKCKIRENEASPCFRTGVLPYGSASQPGKEDKHFTIAPLDPALPDGACGEQAGQAGFSILQHPNCGDRTLPA